MKNRPQRLIFFLVVWLTMFSCIFVKGQESSIKVGSKDFSHLVPPGTDVLIASRRSTDFIDLPVAQQGLMPFNGIYGELYTIPSNIFYTQSGIMCKMEWQVEKATRIPFRFRLGSLADCNALEGKR